MIVYIHYIRFWKEFEHFTICHRFVPQKSSQTKISVQKIYWGVLLRSTAKEEEKRKKQDEARVEVELQYATSKKVSNNPEGLKLVWSFRAFPNWTKRWDLFILSQIVIEHGLFWKGGMIFSNVALLCQGNVKGDCLLAPFTAAGNMPSSRIGNRGGGQILAFTEAQLLTPGIHIFTKVLGAAPPGGFWVASFPWGNW